MKLVTAAQFAQLVQNGRRQAPVKGTEAEIDFVPVVRLFNPCGTVSLSELAAVRGPLGLGIERDLHFKGYKPISAYIEEASRLGRISA